MSQIVLINTRLKNAEMCCSLHAKKINKKTHEALWVLKESYLQIM